MSKPNPDPTLPAHAAVAAAAPVTVPTELPANGAEGADASVAVAPTQGEATLLNGAPVYGRDENNAHGGLQPVALVQGDVPATASAVDAMRSVQRQRDLFRYAGRLGARPVDR